MTTKPIVAVAMSGGVDSSVAAMLLRRQGYPCVGLFMKMRQAEQPLQEIADEARQMAELLGVELHVLQFDEELNALKDYLVAEYIAARTPNPCPICNRRLKFGRMMEFASRLGARYFATGHYARVLRQDGAVRLCRASRAEQDQSYMLFNVRREVLQRVMFPLGELDKQTVRRLAREARLPVHDKPDSQEICFLGSSHYSKLVRSVLQAEQTGGPIVDHTGKLVGRHSGIYNFTIGQRRGLGYAAGVPMYVTAIDAETNTVHIGPRQALLHRRLIAAKVNWLIEPPAAPLSALVQIRYRHTAAAATITPQADDRVLVEFAEPVCAATPGQAAVFYDGQFLLGGGWIEWAGD